MQDQLYNIICDPDILVVAYAQLKSNYGILAAGPSGTTADGVSLNPPIGYNRLPLNKRVVIKELNDELKEHKFKWSPFKRIMIPKPGKKEKRPLGIPEFKDKLVQGAIRLVLASRLRETVH